MDAANISLKLATGPGAALQGDEPKTVRDLEALARRYRIMDNDRKAFSEETRKELRRQEAIIDRLTQENKQLLDRVAEATFQAGGSKARMQEAEALAQEKQQLEQQISQEKDGLKGLEKRIKAAKKSIEELRSTKADVERARPTPQAIEAQVKLLENRLQQATTRYNKVLAGNKSLREQISHLRSEHLSFEKIHEAMRDEAERKQQEISDLMARARDEFKRRETLQEHLQRLRDSAAKESASFQEEWTELGRILERDQRRRSLQEQQLEQQRQHIREEAQERLAQSMRSANSADVRVDGQGVSEHAYEQAFRDVLASGCYPEITLGEDARLTEEIVHQIVSRFLSNEESNFSLFTYTNELRTEVEQKEEELFKYRDDLSQARSRKSQADAQLKREIFELEQQLSALQLAGEKFESHYAELSTVMNDVYTVVEDLFRQSGCDPIGGVSRVDESITQNYVTAENVIVHLSAVESATDAMLGRLLMMVQSGGLEREEMDRLLYLDVSPDVKANLAPAAAALLRAARKDGESLFA